MMSHWIIVPVILPALLAPIIGFVMRHDITMARIASLAGSTALFAVAIGLTMTAAGGETQVYRLGDWPAPFGIVLVLDRLAALMVLLTSTLGLVVLIHAVATGWDRRGHHFHALFQFQMMGICGAFLTGDVFNLFVFFEVLLIASYGLMIHGGGRDRMRAGLQYVVINLAGSTLFLFALGVLYASVGTLNMADIALRLQQMPQENTALIRVAAMLLMIVFAIKAAIFPMHFWLSATYANAPAPIAALFAIMTKVGAYAIIRVHTISFGPGIGATQDIGSSWLFPAAVVTIAIGAIGVLGARQLLPLVAFSVIGSMGTLMIAVAAFTPQATAAALYYLVHSTFAAAALFLLADLVLARRADQTLAPRLATANNGLFAALFFAAAIGMAGMPPLSGFPGKLLVLDALRMPGQIVWAWGAVLTGSLLTIVGLTRAGSLLFWKNAASGDAAATTPGRNDHGPIGVPEVAPTVIMLAILAGLTVFAGPVMGYVEATSAQIYDRPGYIASVLGTEMEG
ncbi:multisubunit potassium/proton antiporter PhaD subunit [Phaeovulum veldkampii DSM 11550]|nr:multisubunit potassium/proton antiporter PhaD subunit [Phaeovulum veldkampii DSM 11550]